MHTLIANAMMISGVLALIPLILLIRAMLIQSIKNSLQKNSSKVDTMLCDKGHLFPTDLALRLTEIPEVADNVSVCPICFDVNMKNAGNIPQ